MRIFWSLSVTITIFAPAARHFLVQASAFALAPLAPHLSSATQPFTVALFPMSSNAIAVRANTKHMARNSTNTFLMAGFSPFGNSDCGPTPHNPQCVEDCADPSGSSQSPLDGEMRQRKYTTARQPDCQRNVTPRCQLHHRKKAWVILCASPEAPAWPQPGERTHTRPAWHI